MTNVIDTLNVYDNSENRTPTIIVSGKTIAENICPTLLAEAERTKNIPIIAIDMGGGVNRK